MFPERQKDMSSYADLERNRGVSDGKAEIKPLPATEPLLEFLGAVSISTTVAFIIKDKLKLEQDGGICAYFGDNFCAEFLGEVEDPIVAQRVSYAKLLKKAHDVPLKEGEQAIIPELGGEEKAETTLTGLVALMAKQAGGLGILLSNGVNIFYIRNKKGVLRAVSVGWDVCGWGISASSVESPTEWNDGARVFSSK